MNPTKTIFKANTRGHADHGWLKAYHSFSFANYYNPARMSFGTLRVLNDDSIDAGMGFGKHPHDNMEIITIPLEGALEHQDSMGNKAVIKHGEIQVMSAVTCIIHSEYNKSDEEILKLLQIWIIPNKINVSPRYQQIVLNIDDRKNKLQQILSPKEKDEGVWIHQDAWFHIGDFENNFELNYQLKKEGNGIYIFIIKGDFVINEEKLDTRDAIGFTNTSNISIKSLNNDASLLIIEVPMS
jgi:redox-sensitive bicupin YhaK (pirin superfamily)